MTEKDVRAKIDGISANSYKELRISNIENKTLKLKIKYQISEDLLRESPLIEKSHELRGNSLRCLSKHFSPRLSKIPGQRAKLPRKFARPQHRRTRGHDGWND